MTLTIALMLAAAGLTFASLGFVRVNEPEPAPAVTNPPCSDCVPRSELVAWKKLAKHRLKLIARLERQRLALRRTRFSSVDYALRLAAVVYGVPYSQLSAVSWCESTHNIWARNGQYRSLFQEGPMFERGPFGRAGFSVWDPIANAMTAGYTVAREGWREWQCAP